MRFFAFQKKPLFNRGFRREILKVAIFDPPRKPPEIPILTISGHFWDLRFRPLFGPQIDFYAKNLDFDHFRPPLDPPQSKNPGKWPFWRKPGFSSKIWTAKRGGGWGFTQGPPKKAIFGHFCPFWPFLAIFDHFWPFLANSPDFGHFLTPRMWMETGEFWPQKGRKPPRNPPLARQTISNNRVIRPQIWNLRRKRGFFCTPTGAGNMWVNLAAISRLLLMI